MFPSNLILQSQLTHTCLPIDFPPALKGTQGVNLLGELASVVELRLESGR